jgi:hypothetical protein
MTPSQRKYDQDLAASLRNMAQSIEPRSRKLHDILKLASERINALSSAVPVEPAPHLGQDGQPINQPASTPDLQQRVRPARDYGGDHRRTSTE